MNRQSKDFKEIVNIQTDMKISADKWDRIFHNWEHPDKCSGRFKKPMCSICSILDSGESVQHLDKSYKIINKELKIT